MKRLLSITALSVLVPAVAACSGGEGTHDPAVEPAQDNAAFTLLVNPCDPSWRLPTAEWPVLRPAFDGPFHYFEKELYYGNSLWFGRYNTIDRAYERAIVDVQLIRASDKKVKKALWYLALIPYVPAPDPESAAMTAVYRYSATDPVDSLTLGYCLNDNTFLANRWDPYGGRTPAPVVPPNKKIYYEVTMYDPRCTCSAATALTSAVVSDGVWNAATAR